MMHFVSKNASKYGNMVSLCALLIYTSFIVMVRVIRKLLDFQGRARARFTTDFNVLHSYFSILKFNVLTLLAESASTSSSSSKGMVDFLSYPVEFLGGVFPRVRVRLRLPSSSISSWPCVLRSCAWTYNRRFKFMILLRLFDEAGRK